MTAELSVDPVYVFLSYSHRDEALKEDLETHLALLRRQNLILSWHDRMITAGSEWRNQIDAALERADVILLLVSADFIASDYCYEEEMKRAMQRHEKGEATVIPVIVRDCAWTNAPFGRLQALPRDGTAVMLWPDRDRAWRNVEEGLEKVVRDMQARRS